jgi:hypothetical protein
MMAVLLWAACYAQGWVRFTGRTSTDQQSAAEMFDRLSIFGQKDLQPLAELAQDCERVWSVSLSSGLADEASTACYDEQQLVRGPRHLVRIRIRGDLSGFDIAPDAYVNDEEKNRKPVRIHQYSSLAFARFYYNRICSTIEGDYEPPPEPKQEEITSATSPSDDASDGTETWSEEQLPAGCSPLETTRDGVDNGGALMATDVADDSLQSDTRSRGEAKTMTRLHAAVSPYLTESMEAEVLVCCPHEVRSRYRETVEQDAKHKARWEAQRHVVRLMIGALKKHE